MAHAKYLKAISYAKVKTDAVDALTLAQLLRMGYIPEAHQLPPEYRAMRDLLRQRMVMEHKRTNIMQHISSILAQFNITSFPMSASETGFADFLAESSIPEEYRMTLLMYHQQCLQATVHRKQLERYFKARLRPTTTVQLLMSIPGIGENAPDVRQRICSGLGWLGIQVDDEKNRQIVGGKEGEISKAENKVGVVVIPTNEELLIARDTIRCIKDAPRRW